LLLVVLFSVKSTLALQKLFLSVSEERVETEAGNEAAAAAAAAGKSD